jgi:hypothetical protein
MKCHNDDSDVRVLMSHWHKYATVSDLISMKHYSICCSISVKCNFTGINLSAQNYFMRKMTHI